MCEWRVGSGGEIWFHRRLNSSFLDSNFFFFTVWNCSVNPLQDDKAPASHSERRRSHNSKQVAAEQAGLIIRARWCATAECYGLHCLFKSMLGGLCSFTKEGWLGSKASEAKAAKKVLQTQLSLWPEGIPARHQSLYSWPKFCYDLKKKKNLWRCAIQTEEQVRSWMKSEEEEVVFLWGCCKLVKTTLLKPGGGNKIRLVFRNIHSNLNMKLIFMHLHLGLLISYYFRICCDLQTAVKKTEACDSDQETKCKRSLRRSVCLLWGSCMLVKQHI